MLHASAMRGTFCVLGVVSMFAAAACSPDDRGGGGGADARGGGDGGFVSPFVDGGDVGPQEGCGELEACYTVWASSDSTLYHLDLVNQELVRVGTFNQTSGNMTDIAVAPDDTIWGVTEYSLYRISKVNGEATEVAPLDSCGAFGVALTFTRDGKLWAGDYNGAFCRIDVASDPPRVIPVGQLSNNMALSGDIVAVEDGTIFGTAYSLSDFSTQSNNVLVRLNPDTGAVTTVGSGTGYDRLFGVAFDQGQLFAFSHDGTGEVVTVDPLSGAGTVYGTFDDEGTPITFSGAAVNPHVRVSID